MRAGAIPDSENRWSGRRQPEAAARALLMLIAADPQFVRRTLAKCA